MCPFTVTVVSGTDAVCCVSYLGWITAESWPPSSGRAAHLDHIEVLLSYSRSRHLLHAGLHASWNAPLALALAAGMALLLVVTKKRPAVMVLARRRLLLLLMLLLLLGIYHAHYRLLLHHHHLLQSKKGCQASQALHMPVHIGGVKEILRLRAMVDQRLWHYDSIKTTVLLELATTKSPWPTLTQTPQSE